MDNVFAWDMAKQALVMEKHHVGFDEVVAVFADPDVLDEADPQGNVYRRMLVGRTRQGRLLQVIYEDGEEFTDTESPITRIITAFDAERHWVEEYERSY